MTPSSSSPRSSRPSSSWRAMSSRPKVSRISTVPYTPTSPGWTTVHPRPLHPIRPHPHLDSVTTPALPSPPRPPIFHSTTQGVYRLSTHLIPAAFPRSTPDIPLPEIPAFTPGGSPTERYDKVDRLVKQVLDTQRTYEEGRLGGTQSEKPLWNSVNRYVRTSGRPTTGGSGITLFLAHANGFHKETWEKMIRDLLDAPAGDIVDEVWAWESVQHGDAAIVNENLSGIFDWLDNTRDIANFLVHYLPEDIEASVLPTRLSRLPASLTEVRGKHGYRRRKLVVVGHSFGGCTSLRVAFDFPKLFSSFVLVDPVIHRPCSVQGHLHQLVLAAFARRDRWSSREEAFQLFQKSPFFSAWNKEVLRLYVNHGLTDDPEGGVRLKMSALQEGLSFANLRPAWETWELSERLDETITVRWVVPEKPLSTKEGTYERVWRRPANSTNVVFHFAGHLIVQEAPSELAHDISDFLWCKYGSTRPHL